MKYWYWFRYWADARHGVGAHINVGIGKRIDMVLISMIGLMLVLTLAAILKLIQLLDVAIERDSDVDIGFLIGVYK